MSNLLIIFARNPELGKTKTRLAKTLGDEMALAIYYKLLSHIQRITKDLDCDKTVYYSGHVDTEDNWDNEIYKKKVQKGHDLGEKMHNAINDGLQAGYKSVVLIGTDIYELTSGIIASGFEKLKSNDVVIGPAKDGGYYLIGMKSPSKAIFQISKWSTPNVFNETVALIEREKFSWAKTALLNDIDELEDLKGTDLY
ncbi:MAG TPA: TIGR04282 family arsenosugar biosynthesis glycosyltransferase [Fulvivirga sp.]|nr:TIGR04282 family arsenosugar biosynthesis glycosyltransferase [Fulvivirga sp.]